MGEFESAVAEIARYHEPTAESYRRVAESLQTTLNRADFDTWSGCVVAIAASGWHGYEPAELYLSLSEMLLARAGVDRLLRSGQFGVHLSGHSQEPAAIYFSELERLLKADRVDRVDLLEDGAGKIRDRFPYASSLLTEFLRAGFERASRDDLENWARVMERVILERDVLLGFLDASRSTALSWHFIETLYRDNASAAIAVVGSAGALQGLVDDPAFEALALRFARTEESIEAWLVALEQSCVELAPPEREILWRLQELLPVPSMACSLISVIDQLPLDEPDVVIGWLRQADSLIDGDPERAQGYLALESSGSLETLARLRGQVNLADIQRVLQLITEAITGGRLAVEALPVEVDGFRHLPMTDGLAVRLPSSMTQYPDRATNFQLFKVSLLHQLGYYEFGTFAFGTGAQAVFRRHFGQYDDPVLARTLFQILEDARVDWALARRYRGVGVWLQKFKSDAGKALHTDSSCLRDRYLAGLLLLSLDEQPGGDLVSLPGFTELTAAIDALRSPEATIEQTLAALAVCYRVVSDGSEIQLIAADEDSNPSGDAFSTEILFRGVLEPDRVRINQMLMDLDEQEIEFSDESSDMLDLSGDVDPDNMRVEQLRRDDVQNAIGTLIADGPVEGEPSAATDDELDVFRGLLEQESTTRQHLAFEYDEWDCVIEDYRRRWCTLFETKDLDEDREFVDVVERDLKAVSTRVRRQLAHLRPELLRKVKGVDDGEDLDLERTIEAVVDRRSGQSPGDRIYVQRLRQDRDVAALFLLDMSASTDDRIVVEGEEQGGDQNGEENGKEHLQKRIIDIEKEAALLMATSLETLGDTYSICGFSGYGREQVDFHVCKDFRERLTEQAKARIGGIRPCRSTRMGPAIRHASMRLSQTEARTKALIIISDGYPQDHDYGKDRNSREYGIRDTTMALTEARRLGVMPFCLTVDPSGHDYLREMCPDQQYMVIQQIDQLPDALSKVYRSLTA